MSSARTVLSPAFISYIISNSNTVLFVNVFGVVKLYNLYKAARVYPVTAQVKLLMACNVPGSDAWPVPPLQSCFFSLQPACLPTALASLSSSESRSPPQMAKVTNLSPIDLGGRQLQAVDELPARVREAEARMQDAEARAEVERRRRTEAEAEKRRLQAEVKRLLISSSADAMMPCTCMCGLYMSGWESSHVSRLCRTGPGPPRASWSRRTTCARACARWKRSFEPWTTRSGATDDAACCMLCEIWEEGER